MSARATPDTYYVGALAYIDTFVGLIKVKVLAVTATGLTVIVTQRGHRAYPCGLVLYDESPYYIVPRAKVRVRGGRHSISTTYQWEG